MNAITELEKLLNVPIAEQTKLQHAIALLWSQEYNSLANSAAAELAELQADNARLRLVVRAAKKLLAVNPTQRWTVDEMNALDEALKGETK